MKVLPATAYVLLQAALGLSLLACPVLPEFIPGSFAAGQSTTPAKPNDFQVVPGERAGPIHAATTETDLKRIFGNAVVLNQTVMGPEGTGIAATVVYPRSTDRLEVLWSNVGHTRVDSVRLESPGGHWRLAPMGVFVGMSLTDLVKRNNGKPIKFSGFGWDYGGYVSDWGAGPLGKEFGGNGSKATLRLGCFRDSFLQMSAKQRKEVGGERQVSSSAPALRALNPYICAIIVSL